MAPSPKQGALFGGSPWECCTDVLAYSANLLPDPISRYDRLQSEWLYDYFPQVKSFQTGEVGSIIDFFIHPSSF
ncbi:hypothetical protein [Coleofasciculus sp. H7-2]|uniref:hypothetical protein n=1 Tax=Coleofasciculus sp. H7-2 TaxID=3351545 RepID=UPI00366DEDAF